jgi:hypothetical protein
VLLTLERPHDLGIPRRHCQDLAGVGLQDCKAPPSFHNANLERLVEGPAASLAGLHTKVSRVGYVR